MEHTVGRVINQYDNSTKIVLCTSMKALNIRFSDKEHKDLQQTSQLLERSINEIVREAVREYMTKLGASNP
jgi:predicted HicB family RNase H-like nuclease